MVGHLGSIQIVIKCINAPYIIFTRLMIMGLYTDCRESVLDETGATKSSKAGHIVPDKLEARRPTYLYDVIWDP